jgi:hypothetical protein
MLAIKKTSLLACDGGIYNAASSVATLVYQRSARTLRNS